MNSAKRIPTFVTHTRTKVGSVSIGKRKLSRLKPVTSIFPMARDDKE